MITSRHGRPVAAAAALLGLALAVAPPSRAAGIELGERYGDKLAWTERAGCRVSVEYSAEWHTLRYRNECAQPLAAKLALFAQLVEAAARGGVPLGEATTLALGRLVDFPELVTDVALAARAAPDWDAEKGRVRGAATPRGLNRYFARLLDDTGVLRPFLAALAASGVSAGKASVEKVLVGPPAMTPVADALRARGVGPADKLPFDAMVWLSLERAR